jgi:two-component system chemotaxis response regulator CheB
VVGVVLTGSLDDGTAGLMAIKRCGGITVAQDPAHALYPSMPRSAIQNVEPNYVLPLEQIASLLARLAREPADEGAFTVPENIDLENRFVESEVNDSDVLDRIGRPSHYVCPECSGTLWELHEGDILRFRCRVGHAYTAENMMAEHDVALETALWVAIRTLEERVSLCRKLSRRAEEKGQKHLARRFHERADDTQRQVAVLKQLLVKEDHEDDQTVA